MGGSSALTQSVEDSRDLARGPGGDVGALAIVWSADEPSRVGEVALSAGATRGDPNVIGRGGPTADSPEPRLVFTRFRGPGSPAGDWLRSPKISRAQLRVGLGEAGAIEVENVGRLKLSHNGMEVSRANVLPGDLLEIGSQLALYVTRRAIAHAPRAPRDYPIGEADPHGIVGESPATWLLRERIAFVAPLAGHVLIRGASGTGKELVARALHALSPRAARPFIGRNAANFPEGLIDAELFGNAKNYPNAGMPERAGLIGDADESDLFLDEFGELPQSLQAHLLRVLDAGEYQRLGESRTRRSDFRLIAATNRPVSSLKHDVLARLVLHIDVPDLNGRREDIPLIVRHQVRRIAAQHPHVGEHWLGAAEGPREPGGRETAAAPVRTAREPRIGMDLMRELVTHAYETNVRELEATLWRSLAASTGDVLRLAPKPGVAPVDAGEPTDALSPARIQACLDEHNGGVEEARRALGLSSRHALARLIKKHGLQVRRRFR